MTRVFNGRERLDGAATVDARNGSQKAQAMDFLVTMTTQVPEGTPDTAVDEVRVREAARSRELAAAGHLLRLWRPPLLPGEWRTLGLFSAADGVELEKVLASMPLRVWRTDEVVALSAHPNDPGSSAGPAASDVEFLTTFIVTVPADADAPTADALLAREAARACELAGEGRLARLWALPEPGRALGLWRAPDAAAMAAIEESLPLEVASWMTVTTVPLTPHPSDPASQRGPDTRAGLPS
jgi:muconolactone delta-isomerase